MDVLRFLIPVSLGLGGLGLLAFFWTLRSNQYDDPDGDSRRILTDDYDDAPRPDRSDDTRPDSSDDAGGGQGKE
ncbi:cbb3-type cytochrome oxidase assembly protein CcoS [Meridianimarinicoccus roseus]|uniref:Cbb3-type cytochrome oxidase assembly protein CcoS n=1 Tax=Meridianimarinicoccus roseus TaxID=2072018 RepID=A0A2V2LEV3_9RHOB|nr:cbb3-type cytochrome oxidase assembly protein CcoS [Meridianimarinicoccus roseus]